MSYQVRHTWKNNICVVCGLRRKRGAIRLPLSDPSPIKWKTGFIYYRTNAKDNVSIYANDCNNGQKEKVQTKETNK